MAAVAIRIIGMLRYQAAFNARQLSSGNREVTQEKTRYAAKSSRKGYSGKFQAKEFLFPKINVPTTPASAEQDPIFIIAVEAGIPAIYNTKPHNANH